MRAVALALALTRAAAQPATPPAGMATLAPTPISEFSCAFMQEDEDSLMFDWERTQEMVHAWGGFPQCEHLRCDAATGALWLNVQREKVHTFRQKSSKGHTKVTRSYCMVLTPDGRYARYARVEYKLREERWMWREREKVSWKDVPHVNGTLAPDAGFGTKMYDACVAQCPCAASEGRDDFPALSRALLDPDADATQVPGVCFDESPKYWFHFGWITTAHWFLIFYLALSILGVWTLACCVSNRCCYAFGTLQKIRNEFADSCPTLATYLNKLCVEPCKLCVKWCRCCCMCCKATRVKKPPIPTAIEVTAQGPPGTPMTVVCQGGHVNIVVPDDVEEGGVFAVNPLVTQQPLPQVLPDNDVTLDAPPRSRSLIEQFRLLVWKVYWTKRRDKASLVKQVLGPALVLVVVWLLYVAGGLTFIPSLRWNPKNPNYKWKKGKLRDYVKGQVLSHGMLELYLGFIGFIPFVQVVVVSLVEEHGSRLVEYMKMAGLRPQAYWLAQFVSEGVIIGGLSAFMIAVVAAPGLFSFAGHSEVPFFSLLGLHWTYLLALVSVGFCAAALVPNALVASLFALISQVAGVVCYFVGAWREKSNGAMASTSVWHKSVAIQRWYSLYPQFAYMLLVEGFQSHRKKRCRVWGAYKGEAFISSDYGCSAPEGKSLEEAKDSALFGLGAFLGEHRCPAFDEAIQYSYSYDYSDYSWPLQHGAPQKQILPLIALLLVLLLPPPLWSERLLLLLRVPFCPALARAPALPFPPVLYCQVSSSP